MVGRRHLRPATPLMSTPLVVSRRSQWPRIRTPASQEMCCPTLRLTGEVCDAASTGAAKRIIRPPKAIVHMANQAHPNASPASTSVSQCTPRNTRVHEMATAKPTAVPARNDRDVIDRLWRSSSRSFPPRSSRSQRVTSRKPASGFRPGRRSGTGDLATDRGTTRRARSPPARCGDLAEGAPVPNSPASSPAAHTLLSSNPSGTAGPSGWGRRCRRLTRSAARRAPMSAGGVRSVPLRLRRWRDGHLIGSTFDPVAHLPTGPSWAVIAAQQVASR